jgi:hypothetical protein
MALNRGIKGVSFTQQLRRLEEDLESIRDEYLKGMAREVVGSSPVDTGTYVMAHNIGERSSGGQFTGNIRYIGPPGQNGAAMRQESLSKLYAQIDALPDGQTRVNLSNNSAHAGIVENGGWRWKTSAYKVYDSARNNAPRIFQGAVDRVRGGL